MNTYTTSTSTIAPINRLTTGGTPTILQRVSGLMNWKSMAIIIGVLLLILFAYYTYKQYSKCNSDIFLLIAYLEPIPQ